MENTVFIDFSVIDNYDDFYAQLKEKMTLPSYFGDNLDALNDSLSGAVALPLQLEFVNMRLMQLDYFEDLLALLEELSEDLDGFEFSYFLEIYEDDE
ncbi:MAG TPA: barstar family protein [Moheibacter sp.]|nr:barstar family protein [Moheibacter sp.]